MDSLIRWLMCVFRPASESLTDRFALMDYEARRLLSALVRDVVQMTAEDPEPAGDDGRYELLSGLLLLEVDPVSEARRIPCARPNSSMSVFPACY